VTATLRAEAVAAALRTVERNVARFADVYPDDATEHGTYPPRRARHGYPSGSHTGWTTGFWAGILWLAFELSERDLFRQAARIQVERFAQRLRDDIDLDHHDIGFLYSLSCVAEWRLERSKLGRQTALQAADRLMRRFLPGAGIIQAWGKLDDPEQRGRTIVDSLMNLPLLFWASQESGDQRYREAADRHAVQLLRHMVRPDGSTYHTFYFDMATGAPRFGRTAQGHRDESTWSRGQAWAIYGFALAHRYTGDPRYEAAARRLAEVFLRHTPADGVVYWDFDFGVGSGEPKDSSASAIAACGLLELGGDADRASALEIVDALWRTCATQGSAEVDALLLHGTQHRNAGAGVDEGNLWGDYFYLEALLRLSRPEWTPYW
jgi:unsaturated chondroitin disaccharide hydrolase